MRKSQQHKRKQHRTNCDPTTHCAPPPTPPTLPKYLSLQRVATIKFNFGLPLERRCPGPAPAFLLPCGSRVFILSALAKGTRDIKPRKAVISFRRISRRAFHLSPLRFSLFCHSEQSEESALASLFRCHPVYPDNGRASPDGGTG